MSQNHSYSEMIRELSRAYYNRSLSTEEYRAQRRHILNAVDQEYNGVETEGGDENEVLTSKGNSMTTVFYGPTDTQPNFTK
ncbi:hypothetical protein [Teredinibacter franksiae]|jgi:hypothetical protein|uniref:hypothetical protein n=1 Tax=Teredinibacter franksiae TaxID=2761453 RepID=UPI001625CD58|nr:hypothetical protein [Teredinibacter franksiae]